MNRIAARATTRSTLWLTVVALALPVAVIAGTHLYQSASSSAVSLAEVVRDDHRVPTTEADGLATEADGVLPYGVTAFDDNYPGVASLNPDLLQALRSAATDARHEGIDFSVTSGWRSSEYQEQLLREAVSEYGSEQEAARWVATADTSAHVSGNAIDIGNFEATAWLSDHGSTYGLCQIYDNEPWHFELRPEAPTHGCPPTYADPTHDPRMHQ